MLLIGSPPSPFAPVGWNTISAFRVAVTCGIVTLAINKACHHLFRQQQDIKRLGSFTIRAIALTLGLIAGFYTLRKITIIEMNFDYAHILLSSVLANTVNLAYFVFLLILSRVQDNSGALIKFGTTLLIMGYSCTLPIPLMNDLGKGAFIPALAMGAAAGVYL